VKFLTAHQKQQSIGQQVGAADGGAQNRPSVPRNSPPAALANLPDAPPKTLLGAALTAWLDELFRGIK